MRNRKRVCMASSVPCEPTPTLGFSSKQGEQSPLLSAGERMGRQGLLPSRVFAFVRTYTGGKASKAQERAERFVAFWKGNKVYCGETCLGGIKATRYPERDFYGPDGLPVFCYELDFSPGLTVGNYAVGCRIKLAVFEREALGLVDIREDFKQAPGSGSAQHAKDFHSPRPARPVGKRKAKGGKGGGQETWQAICKDKKAPQTVGKPFWEGTRMNLA